MNYLAGIALTGVGATALIDLWALARRSLFAVPLPNYTLVGRWIGHWSHGQFRHESIATATAIRGERALGWIAHYLLGIAFACLLPLTIGFGWLDDPTLIPALLVGVGTVTAPFLVMQPAMGAGCSCPAWSSHNYSMENENAYPCSFRTARLRRAALDHHGRDCVGLRPADHAGTARRIPVAMVQELRDDLADCISDGDVRGSLGAQSRGPDHRLTQSATAETHSAMRNLPCASMMTLPPSKVLTRSLPPSISHDVAGDAGKRFQGVAM